MWCLQGSTLGPEPENKCLLKVWTRLPQLPHSSSGPENKHMKRCSMSLVTGEMQLHITMGIYYTLITIVNIRWCIFLAQHYQGLVSMKTSSFYTSMVKMNTGGCSIWENSVNFLIKLKTYLFYNPAICVLHPSGMKSYIHTKPVHRSFRQALFLVTKNWRETIQMFLS